ncbi:MAG: hypothetical protein IPP74_01190 [Alphaproteobacteria bacterium]|nr:hypothetical protein [Alphaproteobacteria bacterium]
MPMYKKIVSAAVISLLVAGCSCKSSVRVQPIQRKDKLLTCKELALEINEAEYFRRAAEVNKDSPVDIFLPLCYAHSQESAQRAVKSADERLEYLNHIYDLLGCARQRPPKPPAPPTVKD